MSAAQLKRDLEDELRKSNQLLKLITLELQEIKKYTNPDGIFQNNIKQNGFLLETLAMIQQADLENIAPRTENQNAS